MLMVSKVRLLLHMSLQHQANISDTHNSLRLLPPRRQVRPLQQPLRHLPPSSLPLPLSPLLLPRLRLLPQRPNRQMPPFLPPLKLHLSQPQLNSVPLVTPPLSWQERHCSRQFRTWWRWVLSGSMSCARCGPVSITPNAPSNICSTYVHF